MCIYMYHYCSSLCQRYEIKEIFVHIMGKQKIWMSFYCASEKILSALFFLLQKLFYGQSLFQGYTSWMKEYIHKVICVYILPLSSFESKVKENYNSMILNIFENLYLYNKNAKRYRKYCQCFFQIDSFLNYCII